MILTECDLALSGRKAQRFSTQQVRGIFLEDFQAHIAAVESALSVV